MLFVGKSQNALSKGSKLPEGMDPCAQHCDQNIVDIEYLFLNEQIGCSEKILREKNIITENWWVNSSPLYFLLSREAECR